MTEENPTRDRDDLEARWAALQAENERLRTQLDGATEVAPTNSRVRSTISLTLVVLAVVVVVAGVLAAFVQTTIANEDRFVDTFAPLPQNEAVAVVLSERLADELVTNGGVAQWIEGALPPDLTFLAVPVTQGVYTLTADTAETIITSDAFAGIWQAALRVSHVSASAVLSTGGKVSIDLNEAARQVVSELEDRGVTVLSDLEIELPEIVVFESEQVASVAAPLEIIDTLGWFVPLIALILITGAIWLSLNRRRTIAAIGFGTALGLLLTLVIVRLIRAGTVAAIDDESLRAAAEAVWDTTLRFYRQSMWALILLALIVGFAAWIAGPSARAGRTREWWNHTIARWQGSGAEVPTGVVAGFVASWKRPLQWGTMGIGLLFLLLGPDPSVWSVVIPAVVVLAVVASLEVIAGPES